MALPTDLSALGQGRKLSNPLGPMKFGPSTSGVKITGGANDDSDSDCSSCPGCDDVDCSKKDVVESTPSVPAQQVSVAAEKKLKESNADTVKDPAIERPTAIHTSSLEQKCEEVQPDQRRFDVEARSVDEPPTATAKTRPTTGSTASKQYSAVVAAFFAAFAALVLAWQLGSVGAAAAA
jgi:hypothetical protein